MKFGENLSVYLSSEMWFLMLIENAKTVIGLGGKEVTKIR